MSSKKHPANRRQPAQPRREIRPTPTKSASGIPYWPARDPIGERGGLNLYGFVGNDGIDYSDFWGLALDVGTDSAIREKSLVSVDSYLQSPSGVIKTCATCAIKFTFEEAYIGAWYKNGDKHHRAVGMRIRLKGEIVSNTQECQDLHVIQYGSDNNAYGAVTPALTAKDRTVTALNGWRIDCKGCPKTQPYADIQGAATIQGQSFTLEDNPADQAMNSSDSGRTFYTCITAKCGGNEGTRKIIGCIKWGWKPPGHKLPQGMNDIHSNLTAISLDVNCGAPSIAADADNAWKKRFSVTGDFK